MMSDFIVGRHHQILADMLMGIEKGDKDRVCVNIPPDMANHSLFLSSILHGSWAGILIKRS